MKLSINSLALLPLCALTILNGCAKDRNLDDYKAEAFRDDLSKLQSHAGLYTGVITSKRTGAKLGVMQVQLTAQPKVVPSTDQTKASAQPMLVARVTIDGAAKVDTVADSAADVDGLFSATLTIPAASSASTSPGSTSNVSVSLQGQISDQGTLNGALYAANYVDDGANFTLSRNGPSLAALSQSVRVASAVNDQIRVAGTSVFANNVKKPVILVLTRTDISTESSLVSLLVPKKYYTATLNYGNGAEYIFPGTTWDQSPNANIIKGQTVINSSNQQLTLTCSTAAAPNFSCDITTNSTSGSGAHTEFTPSPIVSVDSPESRSAIRKSYVGIGTFNFGGVQTIRKVDLSVVFDARTRVQDLNDLFFPQPEENVHVTMSLESTHPGKAAVGQNFPTTKWDVGAKTLDGSNQVVSGSAGGTLTIHCDGFDLESPSPKYNFTCNYYGGLEITDGTLRFVSP
jgi:hypothetical protein